MDFAERFKQFRPNNFGPNSKIKNPVVNTQKPEVLIITCMDLRMSIFNLFGLEAGEAMLLSSAGPVIPAYDPEDNTSQLLHENLSLAINDIGVRSVMLLGHKNCTAASKLASNIYNPGDIPCMKKIAHDIIKTTLDVSGDCNSDEIAAEIEHQIIIHGIKNLFDYPAVINAIRQNRLTVEGLQFDMQTGRLFKLNTDGNSFRFDLIAGPALDTDIDKSQSENLKAATA